MNGLFSLIPLIVIFPLAGVVINTFFGRKLMPTRDSIAPGIVASLLSGSSFVIAVLMFIALLGHPEGAEVPFFTWFSISSTDMNTRMALRRISTPTMPSTNSSALRMM